MSDAICYIIGAGEFAEREFLESEFVKGRIIKEKFCKKKEDYIIGVDGGYEHLDKLNIKADLLVGDFDSLNYAPNHENIVRLPVEKDDTDMLFALKKGVLKGYYNFCIYGGLGGRVSHTIANLQCLVWLAEKGAKGYLIGSDVVITAVKNGSIRFEKEKKGFVSIFAFDGQAKGVTLRNLKYPLQDAVLTMDYPIGVSNEFIGKESEIIVKDGTLLVVLETKA